MSQKEGKTIEPQINKKAEALITADAERIAEKYNIARMTIYRMLKNQNIPNRF